MKRVGLKGARIYQTRGKREEEEQRAKLNLTTLADYRRLLSSLALLVSNNNNKLQGGDPNCAPPRPLLTFRLSSTSMGVVATQAELRVKVPYDLIARL